MARQTNTPAFAFGGAPRVNLMPRIEIERRERSVLFRRWGWGLAGALLVVVLIGAAAFVLQTMSAARLLAENARTTQLLTQVAALQPVNDKLALESELSDFRSVAMGTDLSWAAVLTTLAQALPADIAITEYALSPGGLPQGDDPTAEVGVQGDLVLTGATPADIVGLIRTIRGLPGVIDADGWAQSETDGAYRYDLRVTVDQSVYTGDYTEEVAE